jgi:hypothetical protein
MTSKYYVCAGDWDNDAPVLELHKDLETLRRIHDGDIVEVAIADAVPVSERFCSECGISIIISPGANRIDRHYCSNACRQYAYRQRIRLHPA